MKRSLALITLIILAGCIAASSTAYALDTQLTIRLTLRVVGSLELDLEDEALYSGINGSEAEAFSELKDKGIIVDRLEKEDSTLWLFTKTE